MKAANSISEKEAAHSPAKHAVLPKNYFFSDSEEIRLFMVAPLVESIVLYVQLKSEIFLP